MRKCIIEGCTTNSCSTERSLFEINDNRQEWLSAIQANQALKLGTKMFICDLHFDSNDLIRTGNHLKPKKNILPMLSNIDLNPRELNINNIEHCSSKITTHRLNDVSTNDIVSLFNPSNYSSETDMISISMETYKRLCNASVEFYKTNETIKKLNTMNQEKSVVIENLKEKLSHKGTYTEFTHLSPEQNEVINMLVHGLTSRKLKYSAAVRKFCFRILFYSRRAYDQLRHLFNNHLPTVRTLKRWLRVVDASPGITQHALDAIAEKVKLYKQQGKQLHVCLISDEMSMHKQASWNDRAMSFVGFTELLSISAVHGQNENGDNNDNLPLAKHALVFMAVGPDFRITVAYWLLCGLDAVDRASLTKEVIISIENVGAKLVSLTSDGLAANLSVARLLGADIQGNKPHFPSPNKPNERIYIIFDPCHMVKLLRKYFAERKLRHENDDLKWEMLQKLVEKQDSDNFSLGNKLTINHIEYEDHKMKVLYAVQVFSDGTADTLEQLCEDGYEDFLHCEKLVQMLRLINNVFDTMNYGDGKKTNEHFKQPLWSPTYEKFRALYKEYEEFISKLTIEVKYKQKITRKSVKNEIGFLGLLLNMHSTIGIYEDYVKNGPLEFFFTFQYSQDHLETYFSLVRGSLGGNNNPNSQQFEMAYRKLLFCTPHISGDSKVKSNCNTDFPDELLEVSSDPQHCTRLHESKIEKILRAKQLEIEVNFHEITCSNMNPYEKHMCALSAFTIEESIIRQIKIRSVSACQDCLNIFNENVKTFDNLVERKQRRGQHIDYPCSSTMSIVRVIDKIAESLESFDHIEYEDMIKTTFENLKIDSLYESSKFDSHIFKQKTSNSFTHKEEFVLNIVNEYVKMKSKEICSRIAAEERRESRKKRKERKIQMLAGK